MAGVYSLQSSLINGFPHWKHDSSETAIWMYSCWCVGDDEFIGTGMRSIQGPYSIEKWPNSISSKWEFLGEDDFQVAESGDVVFEDYSPKGNFSTLLKFKSFFV